MQPSDSTYEPSEAELEILFEAAKESVLRIRRTLIVIVALVYLSLLHMYMFYFSWERARIVGRQAVISEIVRLGGEGKSLLGTAIKDEELVRRCEREIIELRRSLESAQYEFPLLPMKVSTNDFPIAIQLVGVAALLWLIFNQKRLTVVLRHVERVAGWSISKAILEDYLGLIGPRADTLMKWLGRLLPLSLPMVSAFIVLSDCVDLYSFWKGSETGLAFVSVEYRVRVIIRLSTGGGLAAAILGLGIWEYREWIKAEDRIVILNTGTEIER